MEEEMTARGSALEGFELHFGEAPAFLVRAPGRVNLIGEHTDYNDGFVLPMAIDRDSCIALRPRDDGQVLLHSVDHGESVEFSLESLEKGSGWGEYPKGVAWALQSEDYVLRGWEGVTACEVPLGAGLSSSASFELATARAFECVSGFEWDAPKMALLGQKAENHWVGVNCGIMDQMISAIARAGEATLIDCRDLSFEPAPLPEGKAIIILDTATRRGLVDSAYNERRAQCEEAARLFGVKMLRDVTAAELEARSGELDELPLRRARHVIGENDRTVAALAAMRAGDAARLGELMNASHDSLRDDFEVSSKELDVMVEKARAARGCIGARMTGAGFGGCAVALVEMTAAGDFLREVSAAYETATGLEPSLYLCRAGAGAAR
jgi:galactokinase